MTVTRSAFLSFIFLLFANNIHASERLPPNLVYPHFPACPCQQQAAHVRNRAVLSIEEGRVDMLALRFVQTLNSQQCGVWELSALIPLTFFLYLIGHMDDGSEHASPYVLVAWVFILFGNQYRYQETHTLIQNALSDLLPRETFERLIQDLRSLKFKKSQGSKQRLIEILESYDIDVSGLKNKFGF